jgi:hypothetical protein
MVFKNSDLSSLGVFTRNPLSAIIHVIYSNLSTLNGVPKILVGGIVLLKEERNYTNYEQGLKNLDISASLLQVTMQ